MKYTVVVDNIKDLNIPGEWGLCIYIENAGKKILLDTGASNLFEKNAKTLGIDLSEVDYAVLSHAHYDHANGMERFFELNKKANFYVRESCTDNCYYKIGPIRKYIGIPRGIMERFENRIIIAGGRVEITEGVYLLPHTTENLSDIGKRERMYRRINKKWFADDFSHEQSLVIDTDKGLVIFNSCSHGGAANIINEVKREFPDRKVYGLIGGFHLYNKSEKEITALAEQIKETGIRYVCTGHCSKEIGYNVLHNCLGNMLHQLKVGLTCEF